MLRRVLSGWGREGELNKGKIIGIAVGLTLFVSLLSWELGLDVFKISISLAIILITLRRNIFERIK